MDKMSKKESYVTLKPFRGPQAGHAMVAKTAEIVQLTTLLPDIAAAREYLEALMTTAPYECTSEFALRYVHQGEAKSVLMVLDARGVDLTPEARERISQCRDVDQLDLWLARAVVATTSEDLFR
jgi:hypothetical protein